MQIEGLRVILEQERKDGKSQSNRHRLTIASLRQKVTDLQVSSVYVLQGLQICPKPWISSSILVRAEVLRSNNQPGK